MIHTECELKVASTNPGTCVMCQSQTQSDSYVLCQTCSEDLNQCQVCAGDMDKTPERLRPRQPGVFFVKKGERDNGCTVKLKAGEELHITLPEEDDSWRHWVVKDYTWGIVAVCDRGRFALDPGEMQYGSRTIIFAAERSGTAEIELQEEHDFGSATSTAPWKCTVVVK
jgi:predicted secreted protein